MPAVRTLPRAGLRHHWRGHLAVGAATAVASGVLVGALLVGDSVRGSLREAFVDRLGRTDFAVLATSSFSDHEATGLAARLAARDDLAGRLHPPAPVLRLPGTASIPGGGDIPVTVFGVDARFFDHHRGPAGPDSPEIEEIAPGAVRISGGLRAEGVEPGDAITLRVGGHLDVAQGSFFGGKEDGAIGLFRTVEAWLGEAESGGSGPAIGDFSLFPAPGGVRAVFLRLDELAAALDLEGRANALLVRTWRPDERSDGPTEESESEPDADLLAEALAEEASLDDRGLILRPSATGPPDAPESGHVLESRAVLLDDHAVDAAVSAADGLGARAGPALSYLATTLKAGERETPYSLVTGLGEAELAAALGGEAPGLEEIVPGAWLAADLALRPGDRLEMEFLTWEDGGRFSDGGAAFRAASPVPPAGLFGDAALAPTFPGITDAPRLGDWDPPFPVDLSRIRVQDEEYWDERRALPKAFLRIETARRLWPMRQGGATSVRFSGTGGRGPELRAALRTALLPERFGLAPLSVRADGIAAREGATDFGVYFLYFSGFLLVAAFVLILLLFRLAIERRLPEIGLLLAVGWTPRRVVGGLLREVAAVAAVSAAVGCALGFGWAAVLLELLSGAWRGAVAGTLTAGGDAVLRLHPNVRSILSGGFGGFEAAMIASWWTARRMAQREPRALLSGEPPGEPLAIGPERAPRRAGVLPVALAFAIAFGLALAAGLGFVPQTGGFFGSGAAMLVGFLVTGRALLRRMTPPGAGADDSSRGASGSGSGKASWIGGVPGLGLRAAGFRPGRSLATMALIAFASFILVATEAFRKSDDGGLLPGAGGYAFWTETVFGVPWDPRDPDGRSELGLDAGTADRVQPLRLAGGEDASCLNLYRPSRPRVVGIPSDFADRNRFPFAAHVGTSEEERANPWRLLFRERAPDEAIPVIGDQNSMTYVLGWPVDEERSYPIGPGGAEVRLRLVGTLWDSIFQGELLMAEKDMLAALPDSGGYRLFLSEAAAPEPGIGQGSEPDGAPGTEVLAAALRGYGGTVVSTSERLAGFHRVENTYISTFQALGGLGLLLGTLGLGAVVLRNADERRREWALLAAAGYAARDFIRLGFWENALLLGGGLAAGVASALVAVLPAILERGPGGGSGPAAFFLLAVLASGLLASLLAARSAARRPLQPVLNAG